MSEGYGASERLALVAEQAGSLRGQKVVVRGGFFIDGALLDELSRLMGAQVAVRDEAGRRWIAPNGSPLLAWKDPPSGVDAGEVALRGESFRWRARALAPGLWLAVAIPRSAIDEVMGGLGRSTLIAAIAALAGALLAASLLSARIAAPVRARFDRMTDELRTSRERLVQAERVAAWREMARRLAHELKNPIFPIQLSIETLRRALDQDGRRGGAGFQALFRESSDTILDELRSLRKIIDEFSQFARMPPPRLAPTDLSELVEHVARPLRARAAASRIETRLAPGLPPVTADRDLLARALGNLVANALEAMPEGGTLRVRTRAARRRRRARGLRHRARA